MCREFIKTKTNAPGTHPTCSICNISLMDECDIVLVVNSTTSALQCIHCYGNATGINTAQVNISSLQTQSQSQSQSQRSSTSNPVTPAAPRARNTSDVSDSSGAERDASDAVASFASSYMQHSESDSNNSNAAEFISSPFHWTGCILHDRDSNE